MEAKWLRNLFRRRLFVCLLILGQIATLILLLYNGAKVYLPVSAGLTVISLLITLFIISKRGKNAFKLTWVFTILSFPIFGGFFYLLFRVQNSGTKMKKFSREVKGKVDGVYEYGEDVFEEAKQEYRHYAQDINYLYKYAGFPIYKNTVAQYLTPGEKKLEALIMEMKRAEKYIFLEYFIIENGKMWNAILDVLKQKVQQGVEVRLMFDDIGCFLRIPKNYTEKLESYGIKCTVFNPFRPVFSATQNNRDHRKIAVIDGKVAFTGGINIADEYINAYEKHGHWKDASIMLRGDAAWSFTVMYLQMWAICNNAKLDDIEKYRPTRREIMTDGGYYQPYSDSPLDREHVSEHIYMKIISSAKDYVYINTPYLILDDNMVSALTLAAKSGVDVRICTPKIYDKKLVHMTTVSYYRELIEDGVKIYEYTPGFMHAKTFVSDDITATVGTANLDFRSLYLHYECGVRIFGGDVIVEMKKDYLSTIEKCEEITLEKCKAGFFKSLWQSVLRIFAPLL